MQQQQNYLHNPLLNLSPKDTTNCVKVYPSRWYICTLFVLYACLQASSWNLYGPISNSVDAVYGWTDTFVEDLGNMGNLAFCLLVIPVAITMDTWGVRGPILFTISALVINTGLRLIPYNWVGQDSYSMISLISMVCNGISGTVETLAPPVISGIWFGAKERATATAIMATSNTLGIAIAFIVALTVPAYHPNDAYLQSVDNTASILSSLNLIYIIYFSLSALVLLGAICYFPNHPPLPPSISSCVIKGNVLEGIMKLSRHKPFLIVVAAMAIPIGAQSAWLNALNINLKAFNVSQHDSSLIGLGCSVSGAVSGVCTGRIADKFPRQLTNIIAAMYFTAALVIVWFTLTVSKVLPFSLVSVNIASILIGIFFGGTYPLFFELVMEATFPIPESCTSAFLVMAQTLITLIFLAIPIDKIGTAWMNYTLCGCPLFFSIVLYFMKEKYARLNLDLDPMREPVDIDTSDNDYLNI